MTITPLPTPPSRNDPEATFVSRGNDFLGALPVFATQANALAAAVNADKEATETAAAIAPVALAAANFAGNWSDLTGAISVPASVFHAGAFWTLAEDLADVTTKEPGVDAEWIELPGEPDVSWNYAYVEKTDTASTTSTSFVDTGMEVSITPREAASKILLFASMVVGHSGSAISVDFVFSDSSNNVLLSGDPDEGRPQIHFASDVAGPNGLGSSTGFLILNASNVSARSYKVRWRTRSGTGYINRSGNDGSTSARAASTLLAVEIPQ